MLFHFNNFPSFNDLVLNIDSNLIVDQICFATIQNEIFFEKCYFGAIFGIKGSFRQSDMAFLFGH